MGQNWDIFCNVVDNYGDIGFSWRLARQLANEYGQKVRLWVDDLSSFCRICPEGRMIETQHCKGVEVRHWGSPFPDVLPFDIVVESFGCRLPERYLEKMAQMPQKPVWVNLEYLSAEDWVRDSHGMPSPHPKLPLVKYFFFPGFSRDTGGLLLEKDLLEQRDAFLNDPDSRSNFWRELGVDPQGRTRISLFCYENPALDSLFGAWAEGEEAILCLVPEGRIVRQVKDFFGSGPLSSGSLEVAVIPFVPQEKYDCLLWACDVNFVRGEDSFVRAQWAGKPFVWQIYPQEQAAHLKKLDAFLSRYCEELDSSAASAVGAMWQAWSGNGDAGSAWRNFIECRMELDAHGRSWAAQLSGNNLASNLLDFCRRRR